MDHPLEALKRLKAVAEMVSDGFLLQPGGDQYKFEGSTNHVDELRDVLIEINWGLKFNKELYGGDDDDGGVG